MIRNYLKVALRNLIRYKGFSIVNIAGLAIGLTGCLVIALFVWDELQYDRFIKDGENIYRVYTRHTDTAVVALITVSFQAIRVAMANPVKSLRAE